MANRKRTKQIVIRMSDEEYETLKRKVEQSGLKQQEYLIKAITNKPIMNTDDLKEVVVELKRQGNNLNQLTQKLNSTGFIDYKQELPTLKGLSEVWELLKQCLAKLG